MNQEQNGKIYGRVKLKWSASTTSPNGSLSLNS
jgi:hypothetical protein